MKGVSYKMNNDDELWTRYISKEEDEKMILNGIIAEEREAGVIQTKKDMVISFYKNGASLELIEKSTGISKEEIEEIIKENGK